MKHRSPAAVFFLPFVTFGIYGLVWEVKTKNEMKALGADIPTAWLLIVPIANLYWLWKYSAGVEKVTGGKMSGVLAFVLLFLLGMIGAAILQNEFNKVGDSPAVADAGPAPVAITEPLPAGPNPFAPVEPTAPVAPAAEAPVAEAAAPEVVTPSDPAAPTAPQA